MERLFQGVEVTQVVVSNQVVKLSRCNVLLESDEVLVLHVKVDAHVVHSLLKFR
jgi:hypothetical protein